jgi:hypothetical protein
MIDCWVSKLSLNGTGQASQLCQLCCGCAVLCCQPGCVRLCRAVP